MTTFERNINYRALVSRADIFYYSPVTKPHDGIPVGNGSMGTLLWTRNNTLEMQINRVDVFAQDSTCDSGSDECGACGRVRLDFGQPVFRLQKGYQEHLSLYESRYRLYGEGITVEVIPWSEEDVLAIRVEDKRKDPPPLKIELERQKSLDPSSFREHHYSSDFKRCDDKLFVTQEFSEKDFFCRSAVGVYILAENSKSAKVGPSASHKVGLSDTGEDMTSDYHFSARVVLDEVPDTYTVLISSSATFDRNQETVDMALEKLKLAIEAGYQGMLSRHRRWWEAFWKKSFVHLTSSDGTADFVERCYTYYLYLMASSSRGTYPPKYNGMLWSTDGFVREWGAQYWLFNEEAMYYPLTAANHAELTDPYFNMYAGMLPGSETASRQRWGSKGVFIPETESFNGPEVLPEDIAAWLQAVNYGEISFEDMPEILREFLTARQPTSYLGQFISEGQRWTWIGQIVSCAAELGIQAWQRYQRTGDTAWLREKAYPFLKGAVEFYRNLPSLKREEDGCYHLYNTNVHETYWGVKDSIFDLAVLRGVTPLAIKTSEILRVDDDLRRLWQKLLKNLAPYPVEGEEGALFSLGPGTWAACRRPAASNRMNVEQVWLYPVFFEDWTLETKDPELDRIVQATYKELPDRKLLQKGVLIALHSRIPVMMSKVGQADDVGTLLPVYLGTTLRESSNGLSLWEGLEAMTNENLGLAAYAVQEALLQCCAARPGQDPVLRLFPAWPESWETQFSLLARGGFMVTSSFRDGAVEFVHIKSELGNLCRVRNPWAGKVQVFRSGAPEEALTGEMIEFLTEKGEEILLLPEGVSPGTISLRVDPPLEEGCLWKLDIPVSGERLKVTVGRERG